LGTAPETPRPDATDSGRRHAVEIRRAVHFRAKRADVTVTHVVNQNDDEVGFAGFGSAAFSEASGIAVMSVRVCFMKGM